MQILNDMCTPGQFIDTDLGHFAINHDFVGRLKVDSGSIIACDPSYLHFAPEPLSLNLIPGEYSVVEILAGGIVCGTLVSLSDTPTQSWKQISTFSVDCGWACLVDAGIRQLGDLCFDEIAKNIDNFPKYGIIDVPGSNSNMAVFMSGFGDGDYPCYLGLDSESSPTCLIINFEVASKTSGPGKKIPIYGLDQKMDCHIDEPQLSAAGISIETRSLENGCELAISEKDHIRITRVILDNNGSVQDARLVRDDGIGTYLFQCSARIFDKTSLVVYYTEL